MQTMIWERKREAGEDKEASIVDNGKGKEKKTQEEKDEFNAIRV